MASVPNKWRPPLALVLGGTLIGVLGMSLAGFVALRYLVPLIGWKEAVAIIGGGLLVLTVALAWVLTRLILRPVQALVERAHDVADGRTAAQIPLAHYGTHEFRIMGQAVMDMAHGLSQRAEELATYSSHVTHELRSPLTSLKGAVELLEDPQTPELQTKLFRTIQDSVARIDHLLAVMREVARAQTMGRFGAEPIQTSLNPIAARIAARLGLQLTVSGDPTAPLSQHQMEIVLDHLFSNAKFHGATGVVLKAAPDGFSIEDDGTGVSPVNAKQAFEPFFTTRRKYGGTGMGLYLVCQILATIDGTARFTQFQDPTEITVNFD